MKKMQTYICLVSSGSAFLSASYQIEKGKFNHIAAVFDRSPGVNKLKIFSGSTLAASSNTFKFGTIDFKRSPLIIGSGSAHATGLLLMSYHVISALPQCQDGVTIPKPLSLVLLMNFECFIVLVTQVI